MNIKLLAATVEGIRPIVHLRTGIDETACNKRRRPRELWDTAQTDEPVDCPLCVRREAAFR